MVSTTQMELENILLSERSHTESVLFHLYEALEQKPTL